MFVNIIMPCNSCPKHSSLKNMKNTNIVSKDNTVSNLIDLTNWVPPNLKAANGCPYPQIQIMTAIEPYIVTIWDAKINDTVIKYPMNNIIQIIDGLQDQADLQECLLYVRIKVDAFLVNLTKISYTPNGTKLQISQYSSSGKQSASIINSFNTQNFYLYCNQGSGSGKINSTGASLLRL